MRVLRVLFTLLAHWRRAPTQFAAVLAGLALATGLWSAVQAINGEARASYAKAAELVGAGQLAALKPVAGGDLSDQVFGALRRAGLPVSPVIEGRVRLADRRVRVIGIEPISAPEEGRPAAIAGDLEGGAAALDFFAPPWVAYGAPETVRRLAGVADLPALRISTRMPPDALVMDIGAAQALLDRPGRIDRLALPPGPPPPAELLASHGLAFAAPEGDAALGGLTDAFHLNLTAFAFLAYLVGLAITHAAIGLATEQRLASIRTLRACGASARDVALALAVEIAAMALVAGAAGLLLGYLVAGALLPDVAATLRGLYGVAAAGELTFSPFWLIAGLAMTLAGAALAAGGAVWRAAKMAPLASAKPEAWRAAGRARRVWGAGFAAGLVALGFGLTAFGGGLIAAFGAIACLLAAAAALLPLALDGALAGLQRLTRGPIGEWAFADMRQQTPGLALALTALLFALSANIGVGSMVGGFRLTFLDWLDQRLAAELYIRGADPAETATLLDWAAAQPDVLAALPNYRSEITHAGQPVEVFGVVDHATYRETWPILTKAQGGWDAVFDGTGVMVSEQAARRFDLRLGATFQMAEVVGIYADYGNPKAQALGALTWLDRAAPGAEAMGIGLRIAPGRLDAVIEAAEALSPPPDGMIDQTALKAGAVRVFEQTFTVTSALNILTLGVAGVALFTAMLTLADRRLAALAPVWALGFSRRKLALLELAKTLGLAALTAVFAVPLGVALAWLLVEKVNVAAFGWRLPLHHFPLDWVQLGALSLVVAALAAAGPALRLRRISPGRLLKVFADAG